MSAEYNGHNPEQYQQHKQETHEKAEQGLDQSEVLQITQQEISNTETSSQETRQQLSEVRAQLGLENPGQTDHSVETSEDRLDELREREASLAETGNENNETERTAELNQQIIEKIKSSKWGEALQHFQNVYNERLDYDLNPLAYPEAMDKLKHKLSDMGEALDDPRTNLKVLTEQFQEVSAAMVDTYDVPQVRLLSEHEESLQRVYYAMKDLVEQQNELGMYIGNMDQSVNREDTEDMRNSLNSATTVMERKMEWLARRYEKLQEYNNGY